MNMDDCRSCKNELPERGSYCPSCGSLVRCRKCGDSLEIAARFCVSCGTSTEESEMTAGFTDGRGKSAGYAQNVVEFEEDTRSRRFRASVSDRAIDSVSDPFAFFLAHRAGEQFKRRRRSPVGGTDDSQHSFPRFVKEDDSIDIGTETAAENLSGRLLLPERSEAEQLEGIFRRNTDGQLLLINSRLKQNSQRDFVKRLSVLFLLKYAMAGEEMVPREQLNKILEDAKVYDGNARQWIANADLLSHDGDLIGLSLPGREWAEEVLREVADPNIETKWIVGSKQSGRRGKTSAKGSSHSKQKEEKKTQGKRSRGTSYYALVSKLIADDFFNQEHSGEEVRAELKRMGYPFPLWRINEALVKHTKNEKLSRREYEPGKWTYKIK